MTRKLYPLLEAVGGMLAPILETKMTNFIELEIDRQLKDRTDINRELVEDWIRDELKNTGVYYTAREIDSKLDDFKDTLDVDEVVADYLRDNLEDEVRSAVGDLRFSVSVD